MLRSFGHHWCPCCIQKREFVTWDDAVNDVDYSRCHWCEWQRGKRIDDTADPLNGQSDVVSSIPADVQRAAEQQRLVQHNQEIRARGYGRRPSKFKIKELQRRQREAGR